MIFILVQRTTLLESEFIKTKCRLYSLINHFTTTSCDFLGQIQLYHSKQDTARNHVRLKLSFVLL